MTPTTPAPERILRVDMPEAARLLGASVGELDRRLKEVRRAPGGMDFTHGDPVAFPPPDWVLPHLYQTAAEGTQAYSAYRGHSFVLRELAPRVSRLLGVTVDGDRELVITPGTQAGLFSTLSSLVGPGDTVLVADPDYFFSRRIVRYLGADVVPIPLVDVDGRASLDLDALREAVLKKDPRLLLFSHPNNPTGRVYDTEVIDEIARIVLDSRMHVLVDELYCRLIFDNTVFEHLINREGMRDRCVTLLGPSKTESMSGYRLGVAVGPADIIDRIESVLSIMSLRATGLNQSLLTRWMLDDEQWLAERIRQHADLRDLVIATLGRVPGVRIARPEGSSYAFVDVRELGLGDHDVAVRLKSELGVLVNPGYQFGSQGTGRFRVNFSQSRKAMAESLEMMAEALARWAR